MPRKSNIVKPGIRKYGLKSNYTQAILDEALGKIKDHGLSINACSKEYNIPRSTLKNKLLKKHGLCIGRPTTLTNEEEEAIKKHILALADCGIPIGLEDVKLVIQSYLNGNNRSVKVFKNNLPGWEWGQLFLSRHPELKNKFAHNISRSRAKVNEDTINEFFGKIEDELKDVPAENIFNFDETGFHDDPKRKKVIFRRSCRNPDIIRNATKSCYTVVFCGNAAGELLPPFFIFKAKYTWSDWLVGAPKGSRMAVTKSGWIDSESFDEWFQSQFLPFAKKKLGTKILIGDNLSSHLSINTLRACQENDVKFICLPPNSTHLLQPLDVGYFSSLKSNWRTVLLAWRQTQRGIKAISLPKNCFAQLVTRTLKHGEHQATHNMKGIESRKKFQIPVTAGKSVSAEEIEEYYRKKAENKNNAKKRGRPQGSQNKKKQKSNKKGTSQTKNEKENLEKENSLLQGNSSKKQEDKREEDYVPDENNLPLSTSAEKKLVSIEGNVCNNQIEDRLIDLFEKEAIVDINDPGKDNIEVESYVIVNGVLCPEKKPKFSVGTMGIFRCEGSLFPGKIFTVVYPWYTIVTMAKCFDGGWTWPNQKHNKMQGRRHYWGSRNEKCLYNKPGQVQNK